MRKNFALLGATVVVCLGANPALAKDKDIGQAFKTAALALETGEAGTTAVTPKVSTSSAVTKPAVKRDEPVKAIVAKKKRPIKKRVYERLVAKINLSSQTMNVVVDGKTRHSWKISSGAKGHHTPTGSYKPYYMTSMHYSKKYNNAPMPHSVFFRGGYAVHATGSVRRLGSPASHGCIRLSPGNARKFFKLVQKYRKAGTRIKISGSTPASRGFKKRYARKKPRTNRNNSWSNFNSYGSSNVRYNVRRNSNATVRRIRIGRARTTNKRTVRRTARRTSNGRIFNWRF